MTNLKELFSISAQKYGMHQNIEIDLPQFEKGEEYFDSEFFQN